MTNIPGITLIGLVAAVALAACGGDDAAPNPTATPEAAATATLEPTPTVQQIGGVEARPMVVGPEFDLPEGVALLIEMGCTQCDGPVEGIERVYRDDAGEMRRETLFSLAPAPYGEPYISSLAVSGDGQTLALTVCAPGYCGGLGPVTADAATALHVSRDGGTTWDVVDEGSGAYIVQAVLADGLVLQRLPEGEYESAFYEHFPDGVPIDPPEPRVWPMAYGAGELGWSTLDGRLLREDGSPLFERGEAYEAIRPGRNGLQPGPSGDHAVMYTLTTAGPVDYRLAILDSDEQVTELFALDVFSRVASWLPSGEPIGTAWFQDDQQAWKQPQPNLGGASLPAVFDLEAGLMRPIIDPFLEKLARNTVVAVVPWP